MSKYEGIPKHQRKREKKLRRTRAGCEHLSDKRSAAFIARQLGELQEGMCDLISDLRSFEHYGEVMSLSFSAYMLQRMKRKYEQFAEDGRWSDA